MAATRSTPSLTRRRLGALLRSYRENGDKKILSKTAAKHIGVESTVFGRMERGEHRIHPKQIEKLLELYGVDDPEIHAELRRACMEPFDAGWWYTYRNTVVPEMIDYAAMESSAVSIRSVLPVGVDGLLQSPSYIRDIQSGAFTSYGKEAEDELVAFRTARQQALTRSHNPVYLSIIMSEATFAEPSPVMSEQVRHMLGLSYRKNVEIRLVRMDSRAFRHMDVNSQVFSFRKPWPDVLTSTGMQVIQNTTDSRLIKNANEFFDGLASKAMDVEETRSYLTNRLSEIESYLGNQPSTSDNE